MARMGLRHAFGLRWPGLILAALLLVGCTSTNRKAPVEERSTTTKAPAAAAAASASASASVGAASAPPAAAAAASAPPLPGAENAGKPGYYTVKPGETLMRIAQDNGQNWRDVVRWNNLDNPNLVEVGQVLRVLPPAVEVRGAAPRATPAAAAPETKAPDPKTAAPVPPPAVVPAPGANATASSAPGADSAGEELVWMWPASGPVIAGFDEGRNKGLTIAGKAGDPVVAAGDGRVVYAGSSLRGYGNLVIVKHSEVYLTAYAHNQTLLVKDDQVVRRGQKIAEMGSTDADRVQLHFEIRRQGKPIDPAKLLPPR
jgi:lipoprotein NlpD